MVRLARVFAGALALGVCVPSSYAESATAHHAATSATVPRALAVKRQLGAPPAGVAELKFADIFKLPVGPKGLEPTDKLRSLDGKRVRIVGYMVQQEAPVAGTFLLSPLPVTAGDEDESLADDIPASAVMVQLPNAKGAIVPGLPGLIQVRGTLHVGATVLPGNDRVAAAHITLDQQPERALLRLARESTRARKR
jgi:hypothetical protein